MGSSTQEALAICDDPFLKPFLTKIKIWHSWMGDTCFIKNGSVHVSVGLKYFKLRDVLKCLSPLIPRSLKHIINKHLLFPQLLGSG